MTLEHNTSTKRLARLKHAIWCLEHPGVIASNRAWNISTRRRDPLDKYRKMSKQGV